MDSYALIEGRAWRGEGTETNNSTPSLVLGSGLTIFLESAAKTGIAGCYKPPVAPKGSLLDRRITFELRNPGLSVPNE